MPDLKSWPIAATVLFVLVVVTGLRRYRLSSDGQRIVPQYKHFPIPGRVQTAISAVVVAVIGYFEEYANIVETVSEGMSSPTDEMMALVVIFVVAGLAIVYEEACYTAHWLAGRAKKERLMQQLRKTT